MRRAVVLAIAVLLAPSAEAAISNVDSVSAGVNGSPPNTIESITVGGYTATRADLRVGNTDALPGGSDANMDFFGTWPAPYDDPAPSSNYDLNDILARNQNPNPIRVTHFGGLALWSDVNGANPDFFIFESASGEFGDSEISVQAILPGDVLGMAIDLPDTGAWGDTGISRSGNPNGGQSLRGISFAVTDLLDDSGAALGANAELLGLQINSGGIDPSFVGVVGVPEPTSVVLLTLAVVGFGLFSFRRRLMSGIPKVQRVAVNLGA